MRENLNHEKETREEEGVHGFQTPLQEEDEEIYEAVNQKPSSSWTNKDPTPRDRVWSTEDF